MKNKLCVLDSIIFRKALEKLDQGGHGVVFILNKNEQMIGILTDGDVRRSLLKDNNLDRPVTEVMNTSYNYAYESELEEIMLNNMQQSHIRHLPVLDKNKRLINIVLLDEIEFQRLDTTVILMVGGLGQRLGELTENCPKPMLIVDGLPLLEKIVLEFINNRFYRFVFCVNYLSEKIIEYFGNGEKWGIEITYTKEKEPLGTAGALSLLAEKPDGPFIVMNGDVVTNINFKQMLIHHNEHQSDITIAVAPYNVSLPYGVIEHNEEGLIKEILEKPTYTYHTNAGIYVLNPKCLDCIPDKTHYDMPSLITESINRNYKTRIFPLHEKWIDIGRPEDLAKVRG